MIRSKKIIVLFMVFTFLLVNGTCIVSASDDDKSVVDLSSQQRNAINMLNYLRALSQEIRSSSNSRLFLEEAYSTLINNTNPNAVDSQTLDEVMFMLDTLQSYRMLDVKRDRLQYIYEQNQAQALREAVPNPLGMISLSSAFNPGRLVANIVYMAVDSITSYESAKANTDLQFLKDGWQLDDEEAEAIHRSRKDLYQYMVNMVNAYDLDGSLALNEESIDDFVSWCNNDNVLRKIQNFESNEKTYYAFGPFWLELAKCYYENKEYQKCLDAIEKYENLDIRIFRKDFSYAEILPLAVASAYEALDEDKYIELAADYCQKILNNTNDEQWSLRYFAGKTYCDLYKKTGDKDYLEKSFQVVLNNVNFLLDEQRSLTETYCSDVKKISVPKGATKQLKKDIQQYNTMLEKNRKTELPPIYEPLLINCELLFVVSNELGISDEDKSKLDAMFRGEDGTIFPVIPIDELYRFEKTDEKEAGIIFAGDTRYVPVQYRLYIPAQYLTDKSDIKVAISALSRTGTFDDWELLYVDRGTDGDISSFTAVLENKEVKDFQFDEGDTVKVKLIVREDCNIPSIQASFRGIKEKAADWLSTWDWLDKVSSFSDTLTFEKTEE